MTTRPTASIARRVPVRSGAAIPADAELLRPAQAATVLGISERHLRELATAGQVPVLKLGRSVRIPRAWVDGEIARTIDEWRARRASGAGVLRIEKRRRGRRRAS